MLRAMGEPARPEKNLSMNKKFGERFNTCVILFSLGDQEPYEISGPAQILLLNKPQKEAWLKLGQKPSFK